MWMEKLRRGVLEISTDAGVRYVEPRLMERVRLLWVFRNFHVLSQEVLSDQERRWMDALCTRERIVRRCGSNFGECVIGTMELHKRIPPKKVDTPASGSRVIGAHSA